MNVCGAKSTEPFLGADARNVRRRWRTASIHIRPRNYPHSMGNVPARSMTSLYHIGTSPNDGEMRKECSFRKYIIRSLVTEGQDG